MSGKAKTGSASKIKIDSFDDLFGCPSEQDVSEEQIFKAPLSAIHTFKNHPFRVVDDEKMYEMTESIRQYGVLVPIIVRPRNGGGYEIIAGHRRKRGCELAGLEEIPAILRKYNDDEATIIMVDSNIQREDILPGEKARAYAMKYEAMKHQGKKTGKSTLDAVGEKTGENAKKVQRYIWLAKLTDGLLNLVNEKKLGFSQGVDLSFLNEAEQQWVEEMIKEQRCSVSIAQTAKMKDHAKNGELTKDLVQKLLTDEKRSERKVILKADKIKKYFTDDYTIQEIEMILIQLLDEWKERQ